MTTVLIIVLLLICILMIMVVLLQRGRGGGLSGAFGAGGGSNSAFGTKTGDVFTTITVVLFVVFMMVSIWLSYMFHPESPTVKSITCLMGSPTSAESVQWQVTFSMSVGGVDAADFSLVGQGVEGATVTNVAGEGATWLVIAGTGKGNGTLGLNLVDDDTIVSRDGAKLGGSGKGNGNFTGQVYTIDRSLPAASGPAAATGVAPAPLPEALKPILIAPPAATSTSPAGSASAPAVTAPAPAAGASQPK